MTALKTQYMCITEARVNSSHNVDMRVRVYQDELNWTSRVTKDDLHRRYRFQVPGELHLYTDFKHVADVTKSDAKSFALLRFPDF